MRKSALLLAFLMAATAPTAALAAKMSKVAKPKVVSTTPANQNALSAKVVADGLHQIIVPLEVTLARK